jgi:hypothetical protein
MMRRDSPVQDYSTASPIPQRDPTRHHPLVEKLVPSHLLRAALLPALPPFLAGFHRFGGIRTNLRGRVFGTLSLTNSMAQTSRDR